MKMIDGEDLLAWLGERFFLTYDRGSPRWAAACEVEAALCQHIDARPSPVRLLADRLSHEADDERENPRRAAYDAMRDIVDRLDALADELGEPPLEQPK